MQQIKQKRDFNPFNRIQVDSPNTNLFDLSYDNKLSLDMGKLIPVMVQETLPGDNFTITPEMLMRFAPLTFPIMHRIDAEIRFFYVPNRISWDKWTDFLANKDFHPPYIQGDNSYPFHVNPHSTWDYMGLPLTTNSAGGENGITEKINALPFLAYLRIYNEYFQDQNNDDGYETLKNDLETVKSKNGQLLPSDFSAGSWNDYSFPAPIAYEHDYFTSALPFAQKGDAVNIPLQLATLTGDVTVTNAKNFDNSNAPDGHLLTDVGFLGVDTIPDPTMVKLTGSAVIDGAGAQLAGTINQLRTAMALQKFLEKNARSGTRYNELIKAHFDVDIQDGRIQRPEYLGCIKNNVVINEVLQTSQSDISPLGEYAGQANAVVRGNTIRHYSPEHGFIIGILSVRPKTAYFQGINKKFTRMQNLDYYWSDFAHIGEQAILNKELYYNNLNTAAANDTFGYIPRYSEYKYNPSEVHGDFRTTMLDWHLARKFSAQPTLSQEFIQVQDDKRIFAVTDDELNSLYAHIFFDMKVSRKIPFFTNPSGL